MSVRVQPALDRRAYTASKPRRRASCQNSELGDRSRAGASSSVEVFELDGDRPRVAHERNVSERW